MTHCNLDSAALAQALLQMPGVGPVRVNRILDTLARNHVWPAGLAGKPFDAILSAVPSLESGDIALLASCTAETLQQQRDLLEQVLDAGCNVVAPDSDRYPRMLAARMGLHAPPLLFAQGQLTLLDTEPVAIVGARKAGKSGLRAAALAAEYFAAQGITVLTGGAPGVDAVAGTAAANRGGNVILVLPQGITRIRWHMLEDRCDDASLLLSACHPGDAWTRTGALARNRVIAAMCRVVIAIEPARGRGTLHTVESTLAYGGIAAIFPAGKTDGNGLGRRGVRLLEARDFDKDRLGQLWATRCEVGLDTAAELDLA